jgi:hypothetical protein
MTKLLNLWKWCQNASCYSLRNTRYVDRVDYGVQIQLRFCIVDSSCKQPDCFPSTVGVKVNNMMAQLPVKKFSHFTFGCLFIYNLLIFFIDLTHFEWRFDIKYVSK